MTEKFIDDIKLEQQRVAGLIVQLKNEIGQVTNSVAGKESQIQELTGKLDVLKQVEEFYIKGTVNEVPEATAEPEPVEPPKKKRDNKIFIIVGVVALLAMGGVFAFNSCQEEEPRRGYLEDGKDLSQ